MFIARTIRGPEVRSTTIERAITIAQPPLNPCTSRATIITVMLGLNAHSTEETASTAKAASRGLRRPVRSDMGPPSSWPSAMPTKNVVSVSCTWVAVVSRSRPTSGNAGTYMSVANGAIAVMKTTVASTVADRANGTVVVSVAASPGRAGASITVMASMQPETFTAKKSRSCGVPAGHPSAAAAPVTSGAWTTGQRCVSSSPRGAPS
jgi:hypothetical protein